MAIEQSVLDQLWDFADPAASGERFTTAAANAAGDDAAEFATQLARCLGLQGRFTEADRVLDGVAGEASGPALVRGALERGRVRNSAGDPEAALPLFARAADLARAHELTFLLIDALHMLAIVDQPRAASWTAEALALVDASQDPRTKRWAVALHNNEGWRHFDQGRLDEALEAFEAAHHAAVRWGTELQVTWAGEAVEECRAALAAADRAAVGDHAEAEAQDSTYL